MMMMMTRLTSTVDYSVYQDKTYHECENMPRGKTWDTVVTPRNTNYFNSSMITLTLLLQQVTLTSRANGPNVICLGAVCVHT